MSDRSIITPPSQTAWPATAWPPPRTETSRSASLANLTASTTSSAPAHRAIRAGRRSIAPFQTRRASSYLSSPGRRRAPRKRLRSDSIGRSSTVLIETSSFPRAGALLAVGRYRAVAGAASSNRELVRMANLWQHGSVPTRDQFCPIYRSLDLFGGRWGLLVVREILRA